MTIWQVTAYDKGAKGMLIGEGAVMYVLKRLEVAIRDGDRVHAVIRSCSSSSDGKAPGIYAPVIEGQEVRGYGRRSGMGSNATGVGWVSPLANHQRRFGLPMLPMPPMPPLLPMPPMPPMLCIQRLLLCCLCRPSNLLLPLTLRCNGCPATWAVLPVLPGQWCP